MQLSLSQQPSAQNSKQTSVAECLVRVMRGGITESRHRGHVVAVEPDGKIVASLGTPDWTEPLD